ncbi:glycosyltransferase [Treponema primitia]|uniref:glycosyltransferase n=1 Tax=Treponema primitia TaxID=88058 RepID=UPI0002555603|nr:glycosyltransferase [Treponema primitia]
MDKKRKIGIIYSNDDNWIGGKYYLDSVISILSNSNLFDVFILSNKRKVDKLKFIKYENNIFDIFFEKISWKFNILTKIYFNIFRNNMYSKLQHLDVIFPAESNYLFNKLADSKKIFWIPDFQENYYPSFFLKKEITSRIIMQVNTVYSKSKLILSSNAVYNDLVRIYPHYTCDIEIVPFVSSIFLKKEDILPYEQIKNKYNIQSTYFICSNQFWIHKNHIVVIKAVSLLKKENIKVIVYFTGKEYDHRDSDYSMKLKNLVAELNLSENVFFLGFIPRNEQLTLMRYSQAIIQPSLYEGWNTSIEDAKYLSKEIILSDIEVHKEQLNDRGYYFDPNNAFALSVILKNFLIKENLSVDYSYKNAYFEFTRKIVDIFS